MRWVGASLLVWLLWVNLAGALPPTDVTVSKVRDGDTIEVTGADQQVYIIRLIGISAAERNSVVPCTKRWAEAATEYLTMLVQARPVRLVFDVTEQDVYQRWLAYVFINDRMANALLLEHGLAAEVASGKNRLHRATFQALEREAQIQRRGMWSGL